jgi:UDP-N-acetylmuramoyl-L-alanyl-D-glutamate--2,6-diaminopimelate ligase
MKPRQWSLQALCQDLLLLEPGYEAFISHLAIDSRQVKPGSLFFAIRGSHSDGKRFISNAIQQGAAAILYESEEHYLPELDNSPPIPILPIKHLRACIGPLAARFYGEPSRHMQVYGVTGTSGKSSCSLFLASALHAEDDPAAMLGTLGNGILGSLQESHLTTLDAVSLQQTLADLRVQGVQRVAMEVSSHALDQGRVNGMQFNTAIFTNLSHEHLDYHGDFTHYAATKRRLFNFPDLQCAVINADDPYGLHWLQELKAKLPVYGYTLASETAKASSVPMIVAQHIVLAQDGITAQVKTPWGDGILQASQVGRFNLSNLLAVLAALGANGMPLKQILARLAHLPQVPGRMEAFGGGALPVVLVDYAHKPEALNQVLLTIREYCKGKIWCVFGCGGNRDKLKRPIMGQLAEANADYVIVTDDNPRLEDPKQIIADILQGMRAPQAVIVEHDRERAIAHAVSCAAAQDIVLVAGKGHENYQLIGTQKRLFSDALTVQRLLAERAGE